MKEAILLVSCLVVACSGGVSVEGPSAEGVDETAWRFGQAWSAPTVADCYEVASLAPEHLRIRLAGEAAPGVQRVMVGPGDRVELWVTVARPPVSPFHWQLQALPCGTAD